MIRNDLVRFGEVEIDANSVHVLTSSHSPGAGAMQSTRQKRQT